MTAPSPLDILARLGGGIPEPRWGLMLRARWKALKHIRFIFPRKGCQIWRLSSHFGFKTMRVFCECGKDFR